MTPHTEAGQDMGSRGLLLHSSFWHPQETRVAEAKGFLEISCQSPHFTDEEPRAQRGKSGSAQLPNGLFSPQGPVSKSLIFPLIIEACILNTRIVKCTEKHENEERNTPVIQKVVLTTLAGGRSASLPRPYSSLPLTGSPRTPQA